MTHKLRQKQTGIQPLAVAVIFALTFTGTSGAYAEETATALETAATQIAQSVQQDTSVNPQTADKSARKLWRKERMQKFLENHPKLKERLDKNNDGKIEKHEFKKGRAAWNRKHENKSLRDYDNNPPGPKGGRGTNWENPPGRKGGAGASPDRHGRRQHHKNW